MRYTNDRREYGTLVTRPHTIAGRSGYSLCTGCGKLYTSMGISRHWPKCQGMIAKKRAKK